MFQRFERKQTARPSAMSTSGVAFTASSDSAYTLLTGSTKKIARPSSGFLPSAEKSPTPATSVMVTAKTGDSSAIRREGSGLASSLSMHRLARGRAGARARPETAHPHTDLLDGRVAGVDRGRHAAARHHHEPVGDLEQLVELLAHHE